MLRPCSGFLPPSPKPMPRSGLSADAGHYLVLGYDKSIILSCGLPATKRAMTQMLRRLAFVLLGRGQDLHRAAGLLDRSNRGFGGTVHLDRELGLEFAAAEQPQAVLGATDHAGLHQRFDGHGFLGVDQLGVDRFLQPVEIDLGEVEPEDVVETALRQASMQRHLAALEALDAHARTRGLALAAAARSLALAGTDATADAHALLARAGVVGDIAELHREIPLSLGSMILTENRSPLFGIMLILNYFSPTMRTRC